MVDEMLTKQRSEVVARIIDETLTKQWRETVSRIETDEDYKLPFLIGLSEEVKDLIKNWSFVAGSFWKTEDGDAIYFEVYFKDQKHLLRFYPKQNYHFAELDLTDVERSLISGYIKDFNILDKVESWEFLPF